LTGERFAIMFGRTERGASKGRAMNGEAVIFDTSDATFAEEVLEASEGTPIAVDFWAPWCEPCKALSPVLERVIKEMAGRVRLAKLDVEENPVVASRLGITGVPTVKLFSKGEVVSEFVGLIPEDSIRSFLERALPSREDILVEEAVALISGGDLESGKRKLEEALRISPSHSRAHLEKGKLALRSADFEEAAAEFAEVSEGTPEFESAVKLLAGIEFEKTCRRCGGLKAAEEKHRNAPDSLDAKFDLARCLAAEERYEGALDLLLQIVQKDKTYHEEVAKDDMVRIFGTLGHSSPLAREYRSRLASALY